MLMTVKGIDVASYQSEAFPTEGIDFVFIKVTEGTSYTNPKWQAQRDHARRAGLVVGYYHYAHGVRNLAEADYFLSKVSLAKGEMLAFDWEDSDVSNAEKDAWIRYVKSKAPGHRVLLYCNLNYWKGRDTTSYVGDGLWIADPGAPAGHPRIQHAWTVHQYGDAGGIDRNVANFASKAALQQWAGAAPSKPRVSLAHVVYSARHDPAAPQGHTTHGSEVLVVERALKAEGMLAGQYVDGSWGTKTIAAYAAWQRHLGYSGSDADGVPGRTSLTRLAARHGFTVID
ncbi:GH25 family lysozyme [Streptomyces sp. V3I7]|uniref:GH25 family lysozyme n=1 Tax=Streptomyces sp. V3I7 TaxID=3042278 RepID=UPI00277F8FE3|nr:GH25 family lysozyme [Streptomyces sp. V3I7]MDQ0990623.1 hypothetical protein [Streptomyces sp. V3I7]